jgi:hypothetical protein
MIRGLRKQIPRLDMHHPIAAALGVASFISSSSCSSSGGGVGDEGGSIFEAVFFGVALSVDKGL